MNLNSGTKTTLSTKFELVQVIILKVIQVFCFFNAKNDVTHCKQKVAIATFAENDYRQNM